MRKLLIAVAVVCLPAVASAEEKKKAVESAEHYVFMDDKLMSVTPVSDGMKIGVHGVAVRTLLVRPRLQFVIEMLKSIENL